ncbi:MAG: hypothetical protein K6E50_14495 [Lachnospiraceae bacterium]|nr:hypothetical protein [Lachnospiraceae bacterium]
MEKITVNFGTPEAFKFMEPSMEEEFEAHLSGKAYVSEYDASLYPTEDDLVKAIRSNIGRNTEDSLANWPGKDIMTSKKEALLKSFFEAAYEKMGIKAEFEIVTFMLTEESKERYKNKLKSSAFLSEAANQPKLSDLKPEEHGPVVEICSDYSSHGMAMGSDTSGRETVSWQEDGTVLIEINDRKYGKATHEKYQAGSDAADKLRAYVKESRVAEMAQIATIPSPYQVMDYSSSSHIRFTFDDGYSKVDRRLDCGSYWELQRKTIAKIRDLIKECIDTGECLEKTEEAYDPKTPAFGAMTGFAGTSNPFAKPDTKPSVSMKQPGSWKCSCNFENTGNFCMNCGSPRPTAKWKCPKCNAENEGKFCANCGNPKPTGKWTCPNCNTENAGKFCAECGSPKPQSEATRC